jgi:hypothetical protein
VDGRDTVNDGIIDTGVAVVRYNDYMIIGIISLIGGVIEALVGLRFLFELIGANPGAQFVSLIYQYSTPLVAPFAGILGQNATISSVGAVTASVFDWTALIALIIYGVIFGVISSLLYRSSRR